MINYIGSTEIQLEDEHEWWENGKKSSQPGPKDKQGAEFFAHDGGVLKKFADGNVTIKRHGSKKKNSETPMKMKKNS